MVTPLVSRMEGVDRRQAPRPDGLEVTANRGRPVGRPGVLKAFPQKQVGEEVVAFATQPRQGELPGVEQGAEKCTAKNMTSEKMNHIMPMRNDASTWSL